MNASPTLSSSPSVPVPFSPNEAAKFHFALKTVGLMPGMLSMEIVNQVRWDVMEMITDGGSGRYNIDPGNVQTIRTLIQEKLREAAKWQEA